MEKYLTNNYFSSIYSSFVLQHSIVLVLGVGFEPTEAQGRLIYSQMRLTTSLTQLFRNYALSHLSDSNRRPTVYKTVALTPELRWPGIYINLC